MNDYQSTFNSLLQNVIQHQDDNDSVDNNLVKQSSTIIDILRIRTLADAFLVWACFNYLNFAVKKNKAIGYSFKSKIEQRIYDTRECRGDVDFYYSYEGDVVYVSFYGFTFSFHNAGLSVELKRDLSNERKIVFDGVKKQACATSILLAAFRNPGLSSLRQNVMQTPFSSKNEATTDDYCHYTFKAVNFSFQELCDVFHLRSLIFEEESIKNTVIIFKEMYFYRGLITTAIPRLDPMVEKALFREIIIAAQSVIDDIELGIGARLLGIERPSKHDPKFDSRCRKELNKIIYVPSSSKEGMTRKSFNQLRNNVHLSKKQSIATDPAYCAEEITRYLDYMRQYLNYLYECVCLAQLH